MIGNLIGSFLQSYSQAKSGKEDREQRDKEAKAKTTLYEIELRRAQQAEQNQRQQALMRDQFFSDAESMASPQNSEPMSLSALLADPAMGLKALRAGIVNPGDLAAPKEHGDIAKLRALLDDPKLMDAEKALRGAGATNVKVDTGMANTPSGYYRPDPKRPGLALEPGGPEARAAEEAKKKRAAGAAATTAAGLSVTDTVTDALELVGPMTAGLASKVAVEGTPAYDLGAALTTIKASLSFDKLQEMRQNSPTGGALGSTSDKELKLLEAAVASLDQGQSPARLKKNLEKIQTHYDNWLKAVRESQVMDESGAMGGAGGVIDFSSLPE